MRNKNVITIEHNLSIKSQHRFLVYLVYSEQTCAMTIKSISIMTGNAFINLTS